MVKKISLVRGIALALFVLAVLVVFPQTHARADETEGIVFHTCSDLSTSTDTSFTSTVGGFTFSYCFNDLPPSPSSNTIVSFHGTLVDLSTAPSQATIITGFPVVFQVPPTPIFVFDTQLVVTPSGQVNGTSTTPPAPV